MGERVETSPESGHSRLAAGTAFGRGSGPSLAERREAAQRRLTSMAQTSGAVEAALGRFDDRVMALGAVDAGGSARESVRALLGVACRLPGYDVTLAADGVRVRVRHTAAGLDVAVAAAAPTAPHGIPVPARGTPPGLPSTPPAVGSVNSWLDATAPSSPA
jgi:hypothetical protein